MTFTEIGDDGCGDWLGPPAKEWPRHQPTEELLTPVTPRLGQGDATRRRAHYGLGIVELRKLRRQAPANPRSHQAVAQRARSLPMGRKMPDTEGLVFGQ